MIFSVYLHDYVADTLKCYGTLDEVVNKILETSEQGIFDVIDMPKCEPRDGATRYNIDVTNEYYITLVNAYSINSPKISLRRILYWFVQQEMADVLGWVPSNEYKDRQKVKILKKLNAVRAELERISMLLTENENNFMKAILEHLKNVEDMVNYDR